MGLNVEVLIFIAVLSSTIFRDLGEVDLVVFVCNPNTWDAEAGGSVQSHLLPRGLEANVGL